MRMLMSILLSIKILRDRFHSDSLLSEQIRGRFYVLYKDGAKTIPMYYRNATVYRDIYDGVIVHRASGKILR